MTPNESDAPAPKENKQPGWLSKLTAMNANRNKAPDEDSPETKNALLPIKDVMPLKGGFPWDKVFLELIQRGVDLKIDISATARTLAMTATLTDITGTTRHVSSDIFDFKTHIDEYEKFWQHAISELCPDRL